MYVNISALRLLNVIQRGHLTEKLVALSSLQVGQLALLIAFSFNTKEGEHIQVMRFVTGEQLEVVRRPEKDGPIEIKIREYFISLSKEEADRIKVKPLS